MSSDLIEFLGLRISLSTLKKLEDPVYESMLYLRTPSMREVVMNFDELVKLINEFKDKVLLVSCIDTLGYRNVILIDKGVIVSAVRDSPLTGERKGDIESLRSFLYLLTTTQLKCRVGEVVEERVEAPPVAKPPAEGAPAAPKVALPPGITVEKKARPRPKLPREFVSHLEKAINEVAEMYNCTIVNYTLQVVDDGIKLTIEVKRKGLFGKCRAEDFKKHIMNDLYLLLEYYGITSKYSVEVVGKELG